MKGRTATDLILVSDVVAVIHHTDCGLLNFSNEHVASLLIERAGLEGQIAEQVKAMDFGSWSQ